MQISPLKNNLSGGVNSQSGPTLEEKRKKENMKMNSILKNYSGIANNYKSNVGLSALLKIKRKV
jgi:hypothetical protein